MAKDTLGAPFSIIEGDSTVEVTLVRSQRVARYPYQRAIVEYHLEPTENGRQSSGYLAVKHQLGDDWSSDVTQSERLLNYFIAAGLTITQFENNMAIDHEQRMLTEQEVCRYLFI